jgi:myo-inositol-1(or 4)-monophosphatase
MHLTFDVVRRGLVEHRGEAPAEPGAISMSVTAAQPTVQDDLALLPRTVAAVEAAGAHLVERFDAVSRTARYTTRGEVVAAIEANDAASLRFLRAPLLALRPGAGWAEDELDSGPLLPGEWWVTDPVEGNVNHVHGTTDWAVTATLVRDGEPVLTAVHLPLVGDLYTAVRGGGAFRNGEPIRVGAKRDLDAALVGTGQASPREGADAARIIGESGTAMLRHSLVLRVSVPATLQLIQVADGRMDVFWQFSAVRSGLLAGALLVTEAGGVVSDAHGRPWMPDSRAFIATTPDLHAATVDVLSGIA